MIPEEPPEHHTPSVLTRDPVRIVWVTYALIQGVVIALMAADLLHERTSAVVTGIALAFYVAVSELFVRPETVPRHALEELAEASE